MASSEKFCLRWNDFESNVSTAFRDLREEKDFFDVTLACDDSSQVAAHKVILAACSPFFREVLRRNPHQHPLLYLKGVKYKVCSLDSLSSEISQCCLQELLSVLNFMYQGEVNVAQEELNQVRRHITERVNIVILSSVPGSGRGPAGEGPHSGKLKQ